MYEKREWICPHGYKHDVTINMTSRTSRFSAGTISVTAPKVCHFCNVNLRLVK